MPGLFEGDERAQLISAFRESLSQRESSLNQREGQGMGAMGGMGQGVVLEQEDELWRRFTKIIQRNLHVVFTMNPARFGLHNYSVWPHSRSHPSP